jgi:hypothetical protein
VAVLITVQLKLNFNKLKSGMRWIVMLIRRLVRWVKRCIFRKPQQPQQLREMQGLESSSDNLASLVTLE